ncbi:MAG: STAS domain-containing protein [Thermodesulfobacteriota bacterium]
MAFQISTEEKGGTLVVSLAGSLDTLFAEDLKAALGQVLRTGKKHIVLSLKGVKYVASSAIRVFLVFGKTVQQNQGALRIAEVPANVLEVFNMVGLGVSLPIFDSLSDALGSFDVHGR